MKLRLAPSSLLALALCHVASAVISLENPSDIREVPAKHRSLRKESRELVDSNSNPPNFRVNYAGYFQYLLDGDCTGWKPVVRAFCRGSIEVVGTSSDTIECSKLPDGTAAGWNGYQCINTCKDAPACKNVWQTTTHTSNTFGAVFFECEGDKIGDIDAFFTYEDSGDGRCKRDYWDGLTRNFQIATLGVFNPNTGIQGDFSISSQWIECAGKNQGFYINESYGYVCTNGRSCRGGGECTTDFDRLIVVADVANFPPSLIQSPNGIEVPEYQDKVLDSPRGDFITRSHIIWWGQDVPGSCGTTYEATITCEDGGTLSFTEDNPSVVCTTTTDESSAVCRNINTAFGTKSVEVYFECSNEIVPRSSVRIAPADFTCGSFYSSGKISIAAQLGVYCGNALSGGRYVYSDSFVDCEVGSGLNSDKDGAYCHSVGVPYSRSMDVISSNQVGIFFEGRFYQNAPASCYGGSAQDEAKNPPEGIIFQDIQEDIETKSPTSSPTSSPIKDPPNDKPIFTIDDPSCNGDTKCVCQNAVKFLNSGECFS